MDPKINKPCPENWDEMTGDSQSRHCDKCKKSVHNIAELDAHQAESLLCHSAKSACIRILQSKDGAFKTKSGWMKRVAIAGAATLTLIPVVGCEPQSSITGEPVAVEHNDPTIGKMVEPEPKTPEKVGELAVPDPGTELGEVAPEKPAPEIMDAIASPMVKSYQGQGEPTETIGRSSAK